MVTTPRISGGAADLDVLAVFVRGQGDFQGDFPLGAGLGVGVADVLHHAAHLVVDALLDGAVGHIQQTCGVAGC